MKWLQDDYITEKQAEYVTPQENARNRSNNRLLTLGDKTQCAAAWCEELGFRSGLIYERRILGWDDHRILTTPTMGSK